MSLNVTRGLKTDITKKYPSVSHISIGIGWSSNTPGIEIDSAAFMLQQDGKCRGDEDFIFYGNPNSQTGAVSIRDAHNSDKNQFDVNLKSIPPDVQRVAFTLTIYDGPQRNHNFRQVSQAYIRVSVNGNEEILRFKMENLNNETAVVMAEIYRHNGEWKFNPIAMGYQGGLAALCSGFGIVVSHQPTNKSQREAAPPSELKQSSKAKINLSKINLEKRGDKINLEKKANNKLGEILINLNWKQTTQQTKQKTGFFGSMFGQSGGIDLDLGCLVEMKKGDIMAIQALGNAFGRYNDYPYIALDADDRTGAVSTGENIRINGDHIHEFKRILVYAFIYKGITNWAQADGVVTIKQPGGPDIVVNLDEHDNRKTMCAIAMIENINNETFSVERLVQYFRGHREMDKAFHWGLRWSTGSKD